MKIDERKFPILRCIEKNKLTDKVFEMLENSGYDDKGISDIKPSFDFFINKQLQINYISTQIYEKLLDTKNFIKAKSLLVNSPETVGLILLPETVLPDFSNVPEYAQTDPNDYPINAVLYSWLSHSNHDRISNKSQLENLKRLIASGEKPPAGADWNFLMKSLESDEDIWDNDDNNRSLIIIPIHNERITQATDQYHLISNSEIYGWEYYEQEGRAWYGKIHDFVMSFLLFYNFTESDIHLIHGIDSVKSRNLKLNDEKFLNETTNNIEILDITYFTKLIRTGEFGVSGHFKVQHFGPDNSDAKIVFIDN
jgi:hypothetical protein